MIPVSLAVCVGNMWIYCRYGRDALQGSLHEGIVALAAVYLIWYIFISYWDRRNWPGNGFLKRCGEKSLQIYLLHLYLVSPLRTISYKLGIENLPLLILFGTAVATIIPLYVAYACEEKPWLDAVFHPADVLRKYHLL